MKLYNCIIAMHTYPHEVSTILTNNAVVLKSIETRSANIYTLWVFEYTRATFFNELCHVLFMVVHVV